MMNPAKRFALIVSVSRFDAPAYSPLPGAAIDGQRLERYACDPQRGCFGQVEHLTNPTKAEVERALSDVLLQAEAADGTVLIYFATHGITVGRYGLSLVLTDADPTRKAGTTIAVEHLAQHIAEHPPKASIFVFDVCKAGGHIAGTAALALDHQWVEQLGHSLAVPDGHFMLGACGARENAGENAQGGLFTTLLLETLDRVGQQAPHLDSMPVEMLLNAVVKAARTRLPAQQPSWSGVAITSNVAIGKNPFHSAVHAHPDHHADLHELSRDDRQNLSEPLRRHLGTLALIGGDKPWSALGLDVVEALRKSAATPDAKATFLIRAAEAASRRLPEPVPAADLNEFSIYLEGSIVAVARETDPTRTRPLLELAATLAGTIADDVRRWADRRGWLAEIGPAAAGMAPILFWEKLGRSSLIALACRAVGHTSQAVAIEQTVVELVRSNPLLHRLSWAGQYIDVSIALGIVLRHDRQLAHSCVLKLIARLCQDAKEKVRPIEAEIRGADLGKRLARQLLCEGEVTNDTAEEAVPLLVLLLHLCGGSQIELSMHAASLREAVPQILWTLYVPASVAAQLDQRMDPCTIHNWMDHESMNGLAKMIDLLTKNSHWPYEINSPGLVFQTIAGAAAGRIFRNRCGYGLPEAIMNCP